MNERMVSGPGSSTPAGLRRWARLVAIATLFLIFAGGMVTSTGSGLAVPDWPLSYGKLFPPMIGGIFYEHGHRMVAGAVAIFTAILAVWLLRREPRGWVKRLGLFAIGAVLLQALLGGLTVIFLLPDAISIGHAGLAEIFFCLTVTLATVTSVGWARAGSEAPTVPTRFVKQGMITVAIVYVQILLGAIMRHTGAGLAIPDFPLSYGRLVPPQFTPSIAIAYSHRVGALVATMAILHLTGIVFRRFRGDPWLLRPAIVLTGLVITQVMLGAATIWSIKAPIPTSLHVACGAATLATTLVLTLRLGRRSKMGRAAATAAAPMRTASDRPLTREALA